MQPFNMAQALASRSMQDALETLSSAHYKEVQNLRDWIDELTESLARIQRKNDEAELAKVSNEAKEAKDINTKMEASVDTSNKQHEVDQPECLPAGEVTFFTPSRPPPHQVVRPVSGCSIESSAASSRAGPNMSFDASEEQMRRQKHRASHFCTMSVAEAADAAKEARRIRQQVFDLLPPAQRRLKKVMMGSRMEGSDKSYLQWIVEHPVFESICAVLIVLNSFLVGFDVEWYTSNDVPDTGMEVAGHLCSLYFLIELILRLNVYRCEFFRGESMLWNMFDLVLVIMSIVELLLISRVDNSAGTATIGSGMKTLKMLRIIRVFRVFRFFRELSLLALMIIDSMKALVWALVMLAIILYVFAICFTVNATEYIKTSDPNLYQDQMSEVFRMFGSIPKTTYTLLQVMLGGVSWGVCSDALFNVGWPLAGRAACSAHPSSLAGPSIASRCLASAMAVVEQVREVPQGPRGDGVGDMQELILSCNKDGMEAMRSGQDKSAFEQFKYAEAMLLANQMDGDNTALLAVTCNNLGCYYKKTGKFHGALSYFRRALKMENELSTDEVTLAGTHLNLCAVLSKLEKHTKAFQHALCAIELMSKVVSSSDTGVSAEDYTVLAIAYHNVGMEREFLGQWDQAATAFQNGFQVAKRLLGENHPLSLTLQRNCEEVLRKVKLSKAKTRKQRGDAGDVVLPPVAPGGLQAQAPDSPRISTRSCVHKEAQDWVKSEEAVWASFAQKTLQGSGFAAEREAEAAAREREREDARPPSEATELPTPRHRALASMAARTLPDAQGQEMPQAYDMGAFRFEAKSPERLLKKTRTERALDQNPDAIMEIIETEMDGPSMKSVPNDFRPNRSMKRSTRTSHVVRRTGNFNCTTHRDRVEEELQKKRSAEVAPWKSAQAQKLAAERIQRVWRSWYQYCQENSEWITITWICATMIQSHWRSYHVRRMRMDGNASNIQRHCRGFLVRSVLRSHTAAVAIQRRVVGMLTRKRLRELHEGATHIQRLVRGGLDRKRAKELRTFKNAVAVIIQKHVRVWLARRRTGKLALERRKRYLLLKATVDLQRMFRGWKGRQKASLRRQEVLQAQLEYRCATRIANCARARKAQRLVDQLRAVRVKEMERAATFVRKVWLGAKMRKKYLRLREEFEDSEDTVITIQRYMRGCMCRLKLWREAVRTEEQLWAAVEIQRCWRGYCGRVAWEDAYEHHWRREMAAALIQRSMRGWHARLRVGRTKRKLARAEFERARRRFRAAQRIQAVARGVITRRATDRHRMHKLSAAVHIQRVARGHALRLRMWHRLSHQKATSVQALARGFLVRRRRFHLIAKVVTIQRAYRRWLMRSAEDREALLRARRRRGEAAARLQAHWRQVAERRELLRIQAVSSGPRR